MFVCFFDFLHHNPDFRNYYPGFRVVHLVILLKI